MSRTAPDFDLPPRRRQENHKKNKLKIIITNENAFLINYLIKNEKFYEKKSFAVFMLINLVWQNV